MLNLLFISNSPKSQYLKKVLQPLLKVIIDVVPDFDLGLKDVFEKRPATVCIQDQIAGVTGESVARHIQMLLGTGAPTFILMHEGNGKAKPIKGLFEHLVDLNQPEVKLAENFQNTLKSLLGDQWVKIYIPSTQSTAPISSPFSVPEPSQEDADTLVNDFLSDLETTPFSTAAGSPPGFYAMPDALTEKPVASTTSDKIVEMLQSQAGRARQDVTAAGDHNVAIAEPDAGRISAEQSQTVAKHTAPVVQDSAEHAGRVQPLQEGSSAPKLQPARPPLLVRVAESASQSSSKESLSAPEKPAVATQRDKPVSAAAIPVPPDVPAKFRISPEKDSVEEQIPEDLLLAFEKNYRSESFFLKRSVLVAFVLLLGAIAGGWYLVSRKPHPLSSLKPPVMPVPAPASKQPSTSAQTVQPVQKSPQPQAAPSAAPAKLPAFIPLDGHDSSYAIKNPGWERYVGTNNEIRVFSADGSIKAVQVLSTKGSILPESFLKSVLVELVGSADYQVNSRESKAGFLVQRGTVPQKADVLIYKKRGSLRAFVVSLN